MAGALGRGQVAAGAGIDGCAVGIRRPVAGYGRADIAARAIAGIDQAAPVQAVERSAMFEEVFGLPPHRLLPVEAEPGEVVEDRGLEARQRAAGIDVLDPDEEPAASLAREIAVEQGRQSVAQMELAVRGRSETENGAHHGYQLAVKSAPCCLNAR
jgi:hypothetical protein